MEKIEAILNKVSKAVQPDEKALRRRVDDFLQRLNTALKNYRIQATAVAGGSIAKGTYLKDDFDIDIFVLFDYERYEHQIISLVLGNVLRSFKPLKVPGSRDYFQIREGMLMYEVIPVLAISTPSKAKNVTDVSPMHVSWVKERCKENLRLQQEIRLVKAFCKAQEVYGAESYIKGFSGHVLDILTIVYGGFLPLLKAAQHWKAKIVVDYNNVYNGHALEQLNRAKTESPLIVVDPLQPERNASAALSIEKFEAFIEAATAFLTNPSEVFFVKKETTLDEIRGLTGKNELILLKVVPKDGKKDIVGSKLLKAHEYLKKNILAHDFKLINEGWKWDKTRDKGKNASFWYIIPKKTLSKYYEKQGPPLSQQQNVTAFKQRHAVTFVRGNRIYAHVQRKYKKASDLVKHLLHDTYITERVKRIVFEKK
ncbi:nucleotidyltransferase domain-containing protein [Candidatus Woesearchaeota archaeon]|nr:nucleotidyltransferase domain-containing protein [Candidatus Woesearchaeota archaeon]